MVNKPPLLIIVGPTAVGKTALSLKIARKFSGEVVSADSRLFYKGMDIGTAKPNKEELTLVQHHLVDITDPDRPITLGQYRRLAASAIEDIHRRERLPILVGGTGQYIWALVEGWGIPEVPPQHDFRRALEGMTEGELARWLEHLDPVAAGRIDPRNKRRVIRALEVTLVAGRPISELQRKIDPGYNAFIIGLMCEREALYGRIDERVDQMIASGLLEEVRGLLAEGYGSQFPAMSGLGYRQLKRHLDGEIDLDEAIQQIKFDTHRFVRQQSTWFRLDDSRISWLDTAEVAWQDKAMRMVENWLKVNIMRR